MTMPAGTYYIGDLCYVMHDEWNEFCDITIDGHSCLDGEFALADGRRFATYGTAYGDGVYYPNVGGSCGVDAGLIGCIRIEDIRPSANNNDPAKVGIIVAFDKDFETEECDGTIVFGHVRIETGDTASEDEDYDGYDEDEEDE